MGRIIRKGGGEGEGENMREEVRWDFKKSDQEIKEHRGEK